jgi:glycosyltransferase involved in cell wall biosynthesis
MPFSPTRYFNIFLVTRLLSLMKAKNTELLFFDQPWFGWLMLLLKVFSKKKIFIRSNNIEYLRFRSMKKWFWQMLYIYEKWTYRTADLVIFVSETDRQKAIYEFDLEPHRTMLTPYGVTIAGIPEKKTGARKFLEETYHVKPDEKILLFFATLNYAPNSDAVEFIADHIYPLAKQQTAHRFKILVCGKNLAPRIQAKLADKPEIVHCGFVDDIDLYIDGADVMINPILSGGGVKTKAIDALSRNLTVVSTQTGAEGIDPIVCNNKLVIIPDNDWNGFVNAVFIQASRKENLPAAFYHTYSWVNIIDALTLRLQKI